MIVQEEDPAWTERAAEAARAMVGIRIHFWRRSLQDFPGDEMTDASSWRMVVVPEIGTPLGQTPGDLGEGAVSHSGGDAEKAERQGFELGGEGRLKTVLWEMMSHRAELVGAEARTRQPGVEG